MKKLIYISAILSIMMSFTSCFEKIDNWYTETAAYDGRYVVASTCEEDDADDTTIADGLEVWIYNSAANTGNEIIVDTHIAGYPVKGKFTVKGNSSAFTADKQSDNIVRSVKKDKWDDDMYLIDAAGHFAYPSDYLDEPAQAGEEYDAVQLYARMSLEEGKIIPQGAQTIGGNTSDAILLKTTMYFDFLVIESYLLPESEWANPVTPKYDWRIKAGSRHNADGWEEHWTLEGYRYTGFPEDI